MTALIFDTLKYANTLKAAGVSPQQAEAHAGALSEALEMNLKELATKADVKELRAEIFQLEQRTDARFTVLTQDMNAKFAMLTQDMNARFIQLDQRMTIKIGTIVSVAVGIAISAIATMFKLFLG
jgi:outer membrane murein-binding lipoprotein Lpp